MSWSRLQKHLDRPETNNPQLCEFVKPVVISDSKGRYLQECTQNKSPDNKILWAFKSGSTTFDRYLWLCQNVGKLIQDYGNICVYIFTGTCDLTIRQRRQTGLGKTQRSVKSRYVTLWGPNSVDSLKRHYLMVKRLLEKKRVKVTFLHVPLYSIERWNRAKGHPDPKQFHQDDKRLTSYVESVNLFIDKINAEMGTYSPKLNEDLRRSRKGKNKKQRYSWNFNLYSDGIHPKTKLAKSCLKSIARKVRRDLQF